MVPEGLFEVDALNTEGRIFCVTAPDLINMVIDGWHSCHWDWVQRLIVGFGSEPLVVFERC